MSIDGGAFPGGGDALSDGDMIAAGWNSTEGKIGNLIGHASSLFGDPLFGPFVGNLIGAIASGYMPSGDDASLGFGGGGMDYVDILGTLIKAGSTYMGQRMQQGQAMDQLGFNADLQREFAQNGVRWRVADARAAGLHPLAALGANVTSFQPQQVFTTDYGVSEFGQDISRAIGKGSTAEEKIVRDLNLRLLAAQVKTAEMTASLKESEAVQKNLGPSFPTTVKDNWGIMGQAPAAEKVALGVISDGTVIEPSTQTAKSQPGVEAGNPALERWYQHPDGSLELMVSKDASEPMESSWYHAGKYAMEKAWQHAKGLWYAAQDGGSPGVVQPDGSVRGKIVRENPDRVGWLEWLRQIQPASPEAGTEYRYWPVNGRWYLVHSRGSSRVLMSVNDEIFLWR